MNQAVVLTKNAIYMVLSELAKPLVSYFLIVYMSRAMGKEGVGLYSTVLALLVLFETLATLGMGSVITRDVAVDQGRASTYVTSALLVGVMTSILAIILLLLFTRLSDFEVQVNSGIRIISISLIFFVSTAITQAFFEGLQRMEFKSIANTLETFLRVLLGIYAIRSGYGIEGVLWATVMVQVFICLSSLVVIRRVIAAPLAKPDRHLVYRLIRQSMTFLLITSMVAAYSNIDVLILSKLRGTEEVGIYAAAYRLVFILKGLSYGYIVALFPQMASAYKTSCGNLSSRCSQSIRYLAVLMFPVSVGTTILSGPIVGRIYGDGFAGSATCLQILVWTICLFPIALVFARALVASHNQVYDLISNGAAMISSIALNLMLISIWGFTGAAIAAVLSMLIFLTFEYVFVSKRLFKLNLLAECKKPLIAGLTMGLYTYAFREYNLFAVILTSAFIYFLLICLFRTFSAKELEAFHQVWRNKYRLLFKPVRESSQ